MEGETGQETECAALHPEHVVVVYRIINLGNGNGGVLDRKTTIRIKFPGYHVAENLTRMLVRIPDIQQMKNIFQFIILITYPSMSALYDMRPNIYPASRISGLFC